MPVPSEQTSCRREVVVLLSVYIYRWIVHANLLLAKGLRMTQVQLQ